VLLGTILNLVLLFAFPSSYLPSNFNYSFFIFLRGSYTRVREIATGTPLDQKLHRRFLLDRYAISGTLTQSFVMLSMAPRSSLTCNITHIKGMGYCSYPGIYCGWCGRMSSLRCCLASGLQPAVTSNISQIWS